MGWVKPLLGMAIMAVGLLYVLWEIAPWITSQIRRKRSMSLVVFIFVGAGLGAVAWLAWRNTVASPSLQALISPQITWVSPPPIVAGTPLSDKQLNATSPVGGSFTYVPDIGAVLPIGTHLLTVTFTPNDSSRYMVHTENRSIVVNPAEVHTQPQSQPHDSMPLGDGESKEQRVLTEYQRSRLRTLFSKREYQGKTVVFLVSGEKESWAYAREMTSVFSSSKWNVLGPFAAQSTELAMDIQVSMSNLIPPPSQVPQIVLNYFQFVQLKCRRNMILDGDVSPGTTVVWIGPKSPDDVVPDNYPPPATHLQEILKSNSIRLP
jgi:hypothetical protein